MSLAAVPSSPLVRWVLLSAVCASLAGCATLKAMPLRVYRLVAGDSKPQRQLANALREKAKGKKFIAVAYEGVPQKDGRRRSVFRFNHADAIDKALIITGHQVSDRSLIQSVLEGHELPDTGSFKSDDLDKMAQLSKADILLIGYVYPATHPWLLLASREGYNVILRAVDLKTSEVLNSVVSDRLDDKSWALMVSELFRLDNRIFEFLKAR
ncbi:MAG: hypothetical protein WC943_11980 [Elusimicrobiota bacterium]|jgi:curli biogenesis system outer membrane secretion channel CsgG